MTINNRQKKQLRNIGHKLSPIVTVAGNGLTDAVLKEIQRALNDHELIKIKLAIIDRHQRQDIVANIRQHTQVEIVQMIGKIALLYLPALEPNTKLSNVNGHRTELL
jgi:RNA-binding protein